MPDTKDAPYSLAHKERKEQAPQASAPKDKELWPSDKKTLTPGYLLNHTNHFDPNTYQPEDVLRNKRGYVSPDTTLTTT